MQLKLRHLVLYLLTSFLLIYSDFAGSALIGMAISMQLVLLIYVSALTKKSQISVFKLFLISLPLFLFWGGVSSFVKIYLNEKQILFFLMALTINLGLCFLVNAQLLLSYQFLLKNNFNVMPSLAEAYSSIKENKKLLLKNSALLILFSFLPILTVDWKFIFAFVLVHVSMNYRALKLAFSNH